jgi:hypothetical protein
MLLLLLVLGLSQAQNATYCEGTTPPVTPLSLLYVVGLLLFTLVTRYPPTNKNTNPACQSSTRL